MKIDFSFIIPVYNRPDEIDELLQSMSLWETKVPFEVVIVEDGSQVKCEEILKAYKDKLLISYYYKPNSGPGDSRNYGMSKAKGNYFIILDSDVIMPKHYLDEVYKELQNNYVDFFGGPDAADQSFSNIQKAINFSMTSFITTGGIRGGKNNVNKYEPRSFNMGISKTAYEASGGFGRIHPGEDPDLSIRLDKLGYHSRLFPNAYVYHKRRISWSKFYKQVNKFGSVRPILNKWHPQSAKITFWFPSLFIIGFIASLVLF
ncbi:MAG: glycosyltransferase, partial [bacterium]